MERLSKEAPDAFQVGRAERAANLVEFYEEVGYEDPVPAYICQV